MTEGQLDTRGSHWFQRFMRETKELSPDIEFRRIKFGFYRIYWKGSGYPAYIGECYKEMPEQGYNIDELDMNLEDKSYYEEFEDRAELTRKIKNFVEGYRDSIINMQTRMYLIKNNKEYREMAIKRYKTFVVK